MYLYSLTLQKSTAISQAIYGSFSAPKMQEIVLCRGKILELIQVLESGKIETIYSQEMFATIRNIITFRLTGLNKDFVVIGSDSGKISIVEFDNIKNKFVKVHQETMGKTGVRRIVPGEFVAGDPKGRAVMLGAAEKQKFVYILNRDSNNKMTISSPLEAHKAHTITFNMCGVDVGYENPLFAVIEADYGEPESETASIVTGKAQKFLTFYEMDLGLNHVVRKYTDPIDETAHLLIPVPGTPDGPGGVVVCCENFIVYRKHDHDERVCPMPKRNDMPSDRGLFIVTHAPHRQKDLFFFLLQSEVGDLYKLSFDYTGEEVHGIQVQYFDTIQVCNSLALMRNGYLYAAAEFGDHGLYRFVSLGDDDEGVAKTHSSMSADTLVTFNPREPKNLLLEEEFLSPSIITDMRVEDYANEGNPQIYALCGRGAQSSLRVLRHGLGVGEIAVSTTPGIGGGIWTLQGSYDDPRHRFMIISFINGTLVLDIGEKISESTSTFFDIKKSTLHVGILENNSFIQVYQNGVIHITAARKRNLWQTSGKIVKATSNERQLAVALAGGEIIYFELEQSSGNLIEVEKKMLDNVEILCVDVGPIPEGRQRSRFLAIGCSDNSVRVLSLDPESCLSRISMQMLPSFPESVGLIEMRNAGTSSSFSLEETQVFLHVGLNNGVLLRTALDRITGNLSDSRTRFLGTKGVKLHKINLQGSPAMIALSSRPWLCYTYMSKYQMTPLSYEYLEYATGFSSELCPEGIAGIVGNSLRILTVEKLGEIFKQTSLPLKYTPRKMVVLPETNYMVIVETDHNMYTQKERVEIKEKIYEATQDEEYKKITERQMGYPKAGEGKWASCIRILDPAKLQNLEIVELEENEAAFSLCVCNFIGFPNDLFLVLGTAKDVKLHPRSCTIGFLHVYRFVDGGRKLEFVHKTPVEDVPTALGNCQGRLVAGVSTTMRIYELGKKKLLKKCENKNFSSAINNIQINQGRIFATDAADSFHILKYKVDECQLYIFCDDVIQRWITNFCMLDDDTIAAADKFENVIILRLPPGCDEDAEDDPSATKFKWESGYLNGAAFKLEELCKFHVGEVITGLQKCRLAEGASEIILYTTVNGGIGAFLPFETREEIDFFTHLEIFLRLEPVSLVGRDHTSYRSYYVPVKDVVDGDLCEEFGSMDYGKQKVIADELERNPGEVLKRLEDQRNKIL